MYSQALNAFTVLQPQAVANNRYLWGPSSEYHPSLPDVENDGYNSKWSIAIPLTQLMSTDWASCHNEQRELMVAAALHLFFWDQAIKENVGFHPQADSNKKNQPNNKPTKPKPLC